MSNLIQKFVFKKVEMWFVLLLMMLFLLGTAFFGTVVYHTAMGGKRAGAFGTFALDVAKFPLLAKRVIVTRDFNDHQVESRFDLPGGFTLYDPAKSMTATNYVLISRYDGDLRYNVAELCREGDATPLAKWIFNDPEKLPYEVEGSTTDRDASTDPSNMRTLHPYLDPQGRLSFHYEYGPMYQVDAEMNLLWKNEEYVFHHSLEIDAEGNFWVPGRSFRPTGIEGFPRSYKNDHIVLIDSESGKTLFNKSVTEILIENKLINLMYVYDKYQPDPLHLNDIQPVLEDGPHWKKGDVFLSLGHMNMAILYRPASHELVWWSQELMMHQHDIDLLDEHRIAVFNNNRTTRAKGDMIVGGHNELLYFDFRDGSVSSPLAGAFKEHDIRTVNQGLADFSRSGMVMVEETNGGRLVLLTPEGRKAWEYVNKSDDGTTWTLNWCRYIPQELGDRIVAKLKE